MLLFRCNLLGDKGVKLVEQRLAIDQVLGIFSTPPLQFRWGCRRRVGLVELDVLLRVRFELQKGGLVQLVLYFTRPQVACKYNK